MRTKNIEDLLLFIRSLPKKLNGHSLIISLRQRCLWIACAEENVIKESQDKAVTMANSLASAIMEATLLSDHNKVILSEWDKAYFDDLRRELNAQKRDHIILTDKIIPLFQ